MPRDDDITRSLNIDDLARKSSLGFEHAASITDRLRSMMPVGVHDRLNSLVGLSKSYEALGRLPPAYQSIQDEIDRQQLKIDALRTSFSDGPMERIDPLPMPEFRIPKNPLHETNDRLANIEDRFDQMQEIAAEAANIATALQGSALEFLTKFEAAAKGNDRAARRAIWIGLLALFLAVAAPVGQIAYTEFWRVPSDAAASQATMADMKTELAAMRATQDAMAEKLSAAMATSGGQSVAVLREIRELLETQQNRSIEDLQRE